MRLKIGIKCYVQKSLSYLSTRMTMWDLLTMKMPSASHKHIQSLSNPLSMPNQYFTGSFHHILRLRSFYTCIRHIIPYKVPEAAEAITSNMIINFSDMNLKHLMLECFCIKSSSGALCFGFHQEIRL